MDAEETVREYYAALRRGSRLGPFFADGESTVKFGIRQSVFGADAVREALAEQTATTADWTVESHRLTVEERDAYAWVADEVTLAWTDGDTGGRRRFETRWTATLERTDGETGRADRSDDVDAADREWRFVSMHVSAPQGLE